MGARRVYKSITCKNNGTTGGKDAKFSSGAGGTEPEVVNSSSACHKRFPSLRQAEQFISDWVEMYSSVCKELIKQELSTGIRPVSMNGPPIRFIREPERTVIEGTVEGTLQRMLSEMRI